MKVKLATPELITLDDGLRLVHIHHRSACAGIFGIAVRAGSSDEDTSEYGLAHFVEHTIFKGTRRRSAWHIINRMEAVGGELNAFTTKEETVVYSIFPSGNAPRAIELIADLAINSQFPDREIEKEREVVIDEINSYRDTPSEAIFDDFEELFFAGSPLAHNILGAPDSVRALSGTSCRNFIASNYTKANLVAFYSGPQSAEHIAALVSRYFGALPDREPRRRETKFCRTTHFEEIRTLDIHQTHALLGAGVEGLYSRQRHAVSLLTNIIGGPGMNSLLNVELRERQGLVYSVEASTAMFSTCGLLNIYFGCDPEDLNRCQGICHDVFAKIADGALSERRIRLAKKQYLGQFAIASENRENRIMAAARATLFRGAPSSFDETVDAIDCVSCAELSSIAEALCSASYLVYTPK